MRHIIYLSKIKRLNNWNEKKKRNDKQKASLVFWNNEDIKPVNK